MKRIVSLFLSLFMIVSILTASILPIFAVVSTMELTDAVYPSFLDVGLSYSISGKITSNSKIESVTVGVYRKDNGEAVITKTQTPNTTTYNISAVDAYITFGRLSEGNYIFKVTASDENIDNKVLLSEDLVVGFPNGSVGDKMSDANFKVLDISVHQGTVDWDKIKNETDAVILRLGYRGTEHHESLALDSRFLENYEKALNLGIPIGVYFYSISLDVEEAIEEADFVLDTIEKYDLKLSMPVYYDIENEKYQYPLGRKMCTDMAVAFCERIREENFMPGVYCSQSWAKDNMYMSALSDYTIWIAQYNTTCTYTGKYEMWQYTDKGSVSGISGVVDMNICYKNIPEYIKKMGYNKDPVEETETADYTKLDAVLSLVPPNLNIYTENSRNVLESALLEANSLSRELPPSAQATVDAVVLKVKNAINGLLLAGGFEKNKNSSLIFDDDNDIIYGIAQKTTPSDILNKYITLKGNAVIEYENLDKYVTTDTVINIKINGVRIAQYTVILNGDVDRDGLIDGNDCVVITMLNNAMMSKNDLTSAQYKAADFNNDSKVDEKDNQMIFDYALMK